ncbi:MAG: Transposase [Virgibacillus proomii]
MMAYKQDINKRINNDIHWVVSDYRKDKRTGALSPVIRSEYAEQLFKKGAGFCEQTTNGTDVKGLSLDD